MKTYFDKAEILSKCFTMFEIEQVHRELNQRADELAKGAAQGEYNRKAQISSTIEHNIED